MLPTLSLHISYREATDESRHQTQQGKCKNCHLGLDLGLGLGLGLGVGVALLALPSELQVVLV